MKRKIHTIFKISLLFVGVTVFAQKGNVGIGTTTPDASAVLDIQSANKGLLIPRMNLEQRNTISTPATGLMVFQTDEKSGFYFFNGKDWKPLTEAVGNAKAVALDVDNWSKNGDAVSDANFIGTTNDKPLRFKLNNQWSGRLEFSGATANNFLGRNVGQSNTGINNTAFGFRNLSAAFSGNENTAIGAYAMLSTTTGSFNAALGYAALQSNTIGYNNIALGNRALVSNIGGYDNAAIGNFSLFSNRSGFYNVAIGSVALRNNISGNYNTAIGYNAGRNSVGSSNLFLGFEAGRDEVLSNKLYISNSNTTNPLIKGDFTANNLQVNSKTTGYLAIGDFSTATSASPGTGGLPLPANIGQASGYRLVVQDGILCEKVKVALRATGSTDWADYVFEPEYKAKMLSLEEVEKYINTNKHLPNVPSTAEVQKEGLDFHQTSRMFMEKIEELTLYMIDMKKEINALKAENESLKAKK